MGNAFVGAGLSVRLTVGGRCAFCSSSSRLLNEVAYYDTHSLQSAAAQFEFTPPSCIFLSSGAETASSTDTIPGVPNAQRPHPEIHQRPGRNLRRRHLPS